jgi:hypothetical protein
MFKNTCLLASFITICCISSCSANRINIIKNSLTHIAQAKKDILAEREEIRSITKDAKEHIRQEACGHMIDVIHYEEHMKTLNSTLALITARDDFKRVIDHVTDFQTACIVDKHMTYHNINYTADVYPREQKTLIQAIDAAASHESLTRYTDNELIFNVYYLEATQNLGYELLLKKLDLKTQEFYAELAALEADYSGQTPSFID